MSDEQQVKTPLNGTGLDSLDSLDSLPSVQGDEFLPSIGRWATLGGIALVTIFGATVALSAVLKYNVTVKAPATIRPAGDLRIVQAGTQGSVKSIEVKESQVVKEGAPIASIDNSQLQTRKSQLEGNIQQSRLQLAQVDSQISSLESQVTAETNLMNRAIASAKADLERAQRAYEDQEITAQAQVLEAGANWERARVDLRKENSDLAFAEIDRDRYQQLISEGAISQREFELRDLAVEQKQLAIDAQKRAAEMAKARETGAKAALNPSDATIAVATERIAQERARGLSTIAALGQQKEQLLQSRTEVQKQINATEKELKQVENEISGSIIKAPVEGTVLQLNLRNEGQVVQPGEPIAYIAPTYAPIIIKARVNAQDINKVKPDQKVQMRVSACPYTDYGTLIGTVRTVAPDVMPPASSGGANVPAQPASYEVTIDPKTQFLGSEARKCQLQFGMEGRADIISREETVLNFILRKAKLLTDL